MRGRFVQLDNDLNNTKNAVKLIDLAKASGLSTNNTCVMVESKILSGKFSI